MDVGFAKTIITPPRGLPLAGYFNPRPNTGVLDDLHVRCVLFREGRIVGGFVAFDVCMLSGEFVAELQARLASAGFRHGRGLIFSATHTHTAPYMTTLFGTSPDSAYLQQVADKTVETVLTAEQNLAPAVLRLGSVRDNPFAFNRRYWMKGGGVTTNPGVKNPNIVKPEGPVDREIGVLAVEQEGRVTALLANIVNHTDTVGASLVSADWPGRMERAVQNALGYDPLVMTLIGCAGNVNHIDVNADTPQGYAYEKVCELGRGYAERVVSLLGRLKPLPSGAFRRASRTITIPYRALSDASCDAARAVLARVRSAGAGGGDLTSEGLASGEGAVARFFAEQTLAYRAHCSGRRRLFQLVTLAFGDRFAVTSLPGEPFTEVGLAIKRRSPFRTTWPVALAMGACGYVPLSACFVRGGYETLPVVGGAPREDTADRLIEATLANLARLKPR